MSERALRTGPVTDYLGEGPGVWSVTPEGRRWSRSALCVCDHGKEWPEGDLYEDSGGKACRECSEASKQALRDRSAQ